MHQTPIYTFVTSDGQRKFVHQWRSHNNRFHECRKCGTICKETDAYIEHWLQLKTKLAQGVDSLNAWQKTPIMEHQADIISQNIESFLLSNGVADLITDDFLSDVSYLALPDLLRVLFATDSCKGLMVTIKFYVDYEDHLFTVQSSVLEINHHFDICASVKVLFEMLRTKLGVYIRDNDYLAEREEYKINRIHIHVVRKKYVKHEKLALPLQYEHKGALLNDLTVTQTPQYKRDMENLTLAYENYLAKADKTHFKAPFPCNLFGFQECPSTRELYAVPYHMDDSPQPSESIRNFIILNDILGNFRQLQEISDKESFLKFVPRTRRLLCTCGQSFRHPIEEIIHRQLNCGYNFDVLTVDKDYTEIHEKSIELMKCHAWLLCGIDY